MEVRSKGPNTYGISKGEERTIRDKAISKNNQYKNFPILTYPDDTCKGRQRGERSALERLLPSITPSPCPSSLPCLSYSPAPYPGFEGIILGHVIQQRRQRVDLQINTAHLLPGLEDQGSEHPSQFSTATPPPMRAEMRGGQRGGHSSPFLGVSTVAASPRPPYLWWELYGGLRPSLLH